MSEDRSTPLSPEDRDGGLFLLKKDSERRAILYKVLNEDQDKVISNLMENHIQVPLPPRCLPPCAASVPLYPTVGLVLWW